MNRPIAAVVFASFSGTGCLGQIATGAAANALASSGDTYSSDDDPELVGAAIPFGLKTMESVLAERPNHRGLLLALTQGYTAYAYGFVEHEAFVLEDEDDRRAEELEARASNLYDRARKYGFRNLDEKVDDFRARLGSDPESALGELDEDDVPVLYWTAAAWGLMVAAAELDPDTVAEFPMVERMLERAMELDPDWDRGALHDFKVVLEGSRPGGDLGLAEEHYRRALELNGGDRVGTFVNYAEVICVPRQDGAGFVEHLRKALAVDIEANPSERLNNVISRERAKILLERSGDLFLEDPLGEEEAEFSSNSKYPPGVSPS